MNQKFPLWLVGVLLCVGMNSASAAHTPLALRSGPAMPIFGSVTAQTMNANFGTSPAALPFSGTTTYDFYSLPLSAAVSLTIDEKGGGLIFMRNTGATDFSVNGQMKYFDYDPKTGVNVLIVDTGVSGPKKVTNGKTVNWGLPNVLLTSNITIPAGHMIHMAMTIVLVSGNPGNSGSLIYNGANGASTAAFISQNAEFVDWQFDSPATFGPAATIYSIAKQPDGTMLILCVGSVATTYSLQASLDMQPGTWNTIAATTSDSNGLFSYVDTEAYEYNSCYYRAFTVTP